MPSGTMQKTRKAGGAKGGALPGDLKKLSHAINSNFIKTEQVQVGNRQKLTTYNQSLAVRTAAPEEDAAKAINDFDSKLAEITAMLTRYKDDTSYEDHEHSRPKPKARAATARGRKAQGSGYEQTEEEAYLNQRIHRRAASLGPGAPRSLNVKVAQYRTDQVLRVHLAERCIVHQQAVEAAEAKKKAAQLGTHDFVQANLISLRNDPEPYLSRVLTLSGSLGGYITDAMTRPVSAAAGLTRPRPLSGGSAPRPLRPSTSITNGGLRPTTAASHSAGAVPLAGGLFPSVTSVTSHGMHIHPPGVPVSTSGPLSATTAASAVARPATASAGRSPFHVHPDPRQRPLSSVGSQRGLGRNGGGESACDSGEDGCDSAGSGGGRAGGALSPEALAVLREARLAVTSRPASGGSPTRRQEYLAQRHVLSARRAEHAEGVRTRHEEIMEFKQYRAEAFLEHRSAREQHEHAKRQAEAAHNELATRHTAWSGIAALAFKLEFIKQEVLAARKLAPLRALRKEAAVKIATWYKHLIEKRNMQAMMDLIHRVNILLKDHIPIKREQVRRQCASRLVMFINSCSEGGAASAAIAISQYREKIRKIQEAWKTSVMVRRMQRSILYLHFKRYENQVLRRNSHKGQTEELAARQRIRSATRNPLMSPDPHGNHGDALMSPIPGQDYPPSPTVATYGLGSKSKKAAEVEDPLLEALLATHKTPLPKDIRLAIVAKAVTDQRKKFQRQMQAYKVALELYRLQLPMEELRIRLLQDAGLETVSNLKKPVHPVMLVLLPRPALKRLLQDGINLCEEKKIEAQVERRRLAEQLWLQAQAAKQQQQQQSAPSPPPSPPPDARQQRMSSQTGAQQGLSPPALLPMGDISLLNPNPTLGHPGVTAGLATLTEVAGPQPPPTRKQFNVPRLDVGGEGGAPQGMPQGAALPARGGVLPVGSTEAAAGQLLQRPGSAASRVSDVLPARGRFSSARERRDPHPQAHRQM